MQLDRCFKLVANSNSSLHRKKSVMKLQLKEGNKEGSFYELSFNNSQHFLLNNLGGPEEAKLGLNSASHLKKTFFDFSAKATDDHEA